MTVEAEWRSMASTCSPSPVKTGIPQLIEEMFEKILFKAAAITNPHKQALFAMVHIPYLHSFGDINKRVSRLAANLPLNKNNLIPISFIGVQEDFIYRDYWGYTN